MIACMQTIPLEPVFENEKFIQSNNTVQMIIIRAIYWICRKRLLTENWKIHVRTLSEVNFVTYAKYKVLIFEVLEEVLPIIAKEKRIRMIGVLPSLKVRKEKAVVSRENRHRGNLEEKQEENPAPLMPQFSADAENLRRERIVNEQQFRQTLAPPVRRSQPGEKPPSLTEKPKA